MKILSACLAFAAATASAQTPSNLMVEGVPVYFTPEPHSRLEIPR